MTPLYCRVDIPSSRFGPDLLAKGIGRVNATTWRGYSAGTCRISGNLTVRGSQHDGRGWIEVQHDPDGWGDAPQVEFAELPMGGFITPDARGDGNG